MSRRSTNRWLCPLTVTLAFLMCSACTACTGPSASGKDAETLGSTDADGTPRDGGTSILADVSAEDIGDVGGPASQLETLTRQASFVYLGLVLSRVVDGQSYEEDLQGYHWIYFYDEVRLSRLVDIGTVPEGADRLILLPNRCEAYLDGVLQPGLTNSKCTGRGENNEVREGERAIVFAQRLFMPPLDYPAFLVFKLAVSAEDAVDLAPVGEADRAARLADVIARLRQYRM